jgi:serine/threonine protein kinase
MGVPGLFSGTSRFQIRRCLGSGGFGTVYEAFDCKRNAVVALKVLREANPREIYGFKQEFRSLSGVTHRNLVTLYELLSEGNEWFFSMEFVRGTNFLSYVRDAGKVRDGARAPAEDTISPFARTVNSAKELLVGDSGKDPSGQLLWSNHPVGSIERLLQSLLQLSEGLVALHGVGMVHRDIKPANVLCTQEGRVVLLDFGLAQQLSAERSLLESQGEIAGTPNYMAPENVLDEKLTPAADWYGVGVMLYELLTGRLPFYGTLMERMKKKVEEDPPLPSSELPGIPAGLDALCMQLLARQPKMRPTGIQILAQLKELSTRLLPAASSVSSPEGLRGESLVAEPPFIGRGKEMQALQSAFALSRQGKTAVALLHGGSGMGKSTLCKHFLKSLREQNQSLLVLSGRCYEHEDVPFKALDGVVDSLSRFLRHRRPEELETLLPASILSLSRLFPALLQVPAIQAAPVQRISDDLQVRQAAAAALRELMLRLSSFRPLVLYIDDLQWGDSDSVSLLLEILRPPEPPPLLLIFSYRSPDDAASAALRLLREGLFGELGQCVSLKEVPLDELSIQESEVLVRALLPDATKERAAAIASEARGNAFFVTEISRFLSQEAPAEAPEDKSQVHRMKLDAIIGARVARLPEMPRRLLSIIAVAGQPVARAAVALAAYGDKQETDEPHALALLRSEHLIRVRHAQESQASLEPREELLTYHDRIREVVVANLLPKDLRAEHLRLARALESLGQAEPEQLVFHLQRGGELGGAAQHAIRASALSLQALAYHQTVRLCRLALDTGKLSPAETLLIQERLADALVGAGRPKEAGEAYLLLSSQEQPELGLKRRRQAAKQFFIGGYIQEGKQVLVELLHPARLKMPKSVLGLLFSIVWYRLLLALRGLEFRERAEAEIAPEELLRIDTCEAIASTTIVDPLLAADFWTRFLWYSLRAGEPHRIANAMASEATMLMAFSAFRAQAQKNLARAQAMAERLDDTYVVGRCVFMQGQIASLEGRWRESNTTLQRSIDILQGGCKEATSMIDFLGSLKLWNLRWMGELRQLAQQLPPYLKDAAERGRQSQELIARFCGGYLLLLSDDDPDRAEEYLRTAQDRIASQPFNTQHLFALEARLMVCLYRQKGLEAWKALTAHRRELARFGPMRMDTFYCTWCYLRALTALASGQPLTMIEREARRLLRGRCLFAAPMATLISALLARRQQRDEESLVLLHKAEEDFSACDMLLHTACARFRRGEWTGGEAGQQLMAMARTWMTAEGVRNPERMTAMLLPL